MLLAEEMEAEAMRLQTSCEHKSALLPKSSALYLSGGGTECDLFVIKRRSEKSNYDGAKREQ